MGLVSTKFDKTAESIDLAGRGLHRIPNKIGECEGLVRFKAPNNQLKELPPEFAKLSNLKCIELEMNKFSQLPVVFMLRNLAVLNMSNNLITALPVEIKRMNALTELRLSHNRLCSLPDEVAYLVNLQILDVSSNALVALPPGLRRCTSLVDLNLSFNKLTQVDVIANFADLKRLQATNNLLDHLPLDIAGMTALQTIEMNQNQLTALPEGFVLLSNLKYMSFKGNQLTAVLENFDQLKNLAQVDLSENRIAYLPQLSSQMPKARRLNLSDNLIEHLPPHFLGRMSRLREVSFRRNQLISIDKEISHLVHVTFLDFSWNHLEKVPPTLGSLQSLTELDLSRNRLADLPDSLKGLKSLRFLNLSDNLIAEFHYPALTELVEIHLSYNEHVLSYDFQAYRHLKEVSFAECYVLYDTLPALFRLNSLEDIRIISCGLRDVPRSIGQLSHLRVLDLSCNFLTTLPVEIFELRSLEDLNVACNGLRILPETSMPARNMIDVDLSFNALQTLPLFFPRWLQKCRKLKMARNRLRVLPDQLLELKFLHFISLEGNPLNPMEYLHKHFISKCVLDDRFLHVQPSDDDDEEERGEGEMDAVTHGIHHPHHHKRMDVLPPTMNGHRQTPPTPNWTPSTVTAAHTAPQPSTRKTRHRHTYSQPIHRWDPLEERAKETTTTVTTLSSPTTESPPRADEKENRGRNSQQQPSPIEPSDESLSRVTTPLSPTKSASFLSRALASSPIKRRDKKKERSAMTEEDKAAALLQLQATAEDAALNVTLNSLTVPAHMKDALLRRTTRVSDALDGTQRRLDNAHPAHRRPAPLGGDRARRRVKRDYVVGWAEMNGRRPIQEDALSVIEEFCGHRNQHLLCVFDGHGDAVAAEQAAIHFHLVLRETLRVAKREDAAQALSEAFDAMHQLIVKAGVRSGATAIVSLISDDRLYVANAGDARAVLSHDGQAVRLSRDHKPEEAEEMARVRGLGGYVQAGRTNGVLAISRSLGDVESQPYVTHTPYVVQRVLTGRDQFVVLACDGVWDVVSDQDVVDLVLEESRQVPRDQLPRRAFEIACRVRDLAYLSGSTDNVSVVIAFFPPKLEPFSQARPLTMYGKRPLKFKKK